MTNEELFEEVFIRLTERSCSPKRRGKTIRAKCPAHGGSNKNSLHVQLEHDRVLIYCHSGECKYGDVLQALDIEEQKTGDRGHSVMDAVRYIYTDEKGEPVGAQVRVMKDGEKRFYRQTWDGSSWQSGSPTESNMYPYNLPRALKAIQEGKRIWIVEGEKDVETLMINGIPATCFMGGASGWLPALYSKWFRNADVVVCGDCDEPGKRFASAIEDDLQTVAAQCAVVDLPYRTSKSKGQDVSDFLAKNTVDDLRALISENWRSPGIITLAEAAEKATERAKIELDDYGIVGIGDGYDVPGIGPGLCIGIIARLGTGKTAWMVDLCAKAIKKGKRVMFVSYDETASSIASYLASSLEGDFTYASWDRMLRHVRRFPNECQPLMNSNGIIDGRIRSADELSAIAFKHKPDIVFVDHLAKVAAGKQYLSDKEWVKLGKIAASLNTISNTQDCAVICAIQSNRMYDNKGELLTDENPAGSDDIGKEMDVMIGLQKPAPIGSNSPITPKTLLQDYGWTLDRLFPLVGSDLGRRIRPSLRVVNTVKSRLSRSDGAWPVVFFGAERRLFPIHYVECDCWQCAERAATQKAHTNNVLKALDTL